MTYAGQTDLSLTVILLGQASEVTDAAVKITQGRSDMLLICCVTILAVAGIFWFDWSREGTRNAREDKRRDKELEAQTSLTSAVQSMSDAVNSMKMTLSTIEQTNDLQQMVCEKLNAFQQTLDQRQMAMHTVFTATLRYFEARDAGKSEAAYESLQAAKSGLDMVRTIKA